MQIRSTLALPLNQMQQNLNKFEFYFYRFNHLKGLRTRRKNLQMMDSIIKQVVKVKKEIEQKSGKNAEKIENFIEKMILNKSKCEEILSMSNKEQVNKHEQTQEQKQLLYLKEVQKNQEYVEIDQNMRAKIMQNIGLPYLFEQVFVGVRRRFQSNVFYAKSSELIQNFIKNIPNIIPNGVRVFQFDMDYFIKHPNSSSKDVKYLVMEIMQTKPCVIIFNQAQNLFQRSVTAIRQQMLSILLQFKAQFHHNQNDNFISNGDNLIVIFYTSSKPWQIHNSRRALHPKSQIPEFNFQNRIKIIKRYFQNNAINIQPRHIIRLAKKTEGFLCTNIIQEIQKHIICKGQKQKSIQIEEKDIQRFEEKAKIQQYMTQQEKNFYREWKQNNDN